MSSLVCSRRAYSSEAQFEGCPESFVRFHGAETFLEGSSSGSCPLGRDPIGDSMSLETIPAGSKQTEAGQKTGA